MMQRFLIIAVLTSAVAAQALADTSVYRLIEQGKLDAARQELSRTSTAALRDGNHLFFQALLESNGARAADLMETALASSVDYEYRELINYRLAQYYYLNGAWDKLQRQIVTYRAKFENGQYRDQMARFSTLLDEKAGDFESALTQIDRYILNNNSGENRQWGEIDKARVLLAFRKGVGADKLLRGLSREKSGPGVPQALYLLATEAVRNRKADDAVFYYNVLREAFPGAIGQDALVDRMAEMTESSDRTTSEADKITGTFYSIQVGVFSDAANARKLARDFERAGHRVDLVDKTISRVTYKVVFVGRYRTYADAESARTRLQAGANESYQVVAR